VPETINNMRSRLTKRYILYFLIHFSFSYGQNVVQNVDWDINDDNEMVITYTLNPENPGDVYKISVSITSDGGRSWFSPGSIEGDLGRQKGYGSKQITWDIFDDVDELEGDVDVEVVAKLHRTIRNRLTFTTKEKNKKIGGINFYIFGPIIDFDSPTYQKKNENGTLGQAYFLSGGMGINVVSPPIILDLHYSRAFFASSDSLLYFEPADYYSGEELKYGMFDSTDIYHDSYAMSVSHTFLPFLPMIMPSIGLGIQLSSLTMTEPGYVHHGVSPIAKSRTDDIFYVGNLFMTHGWFFSQLSYKKSLTRKLKGWSEIQFTLGVHLF
jgi:hypothetical protein